jgi:hypothetical protein
MLNTPPEQPYIIKARVSFLPQRIRSLALPCLALPYNNRLGHSVDSVVEGEAVDSANDYSVGSAVG